MKSLLNFQPTSKFNTSSSGGNAGSQQSANVSANSSTQAHSTASNGGSFLGGGGAGKNFPIRATENILGDKLSPSHNNN